MVATRILVAFEDEYRTYREMIAAGIRVLRPRAEVETAGLDAVGEEIERFDPQLVICSRPNAVDSGGRPAWVELPLHPTRTARVCVGGHYSESTKPTLEVLIRVVDKVEERLLRSGCDLRGC